MRIIIQGSLTFSDAEILSLAASRSSSDEFSLVSEPSSESFVPLIEHAVPAAVACEAEDVTSVQDELDTLEDRGVRIVFITFVSITDCVLGSSSADTTNPTSS